MTQFGPTVDVFRNPADLLTASTFSDPPLNTINAVKRGPVLEFPGGAEIPMPPTMQSLGDGPLTIAFRPHHLSPTSQSLTTAQLQARVLVTEITGSESFIHLAYGNERWIMLAKGVHDLAPETGITVYLDTRHLLAFRGDGSNAFSAIRQAA